MRRRVGILLVLAVVLSVNAPAPALATASPVVAQGSLVGMVREADGSPAAGVEVWLVRTWEEGATPKVTTGPDGRYRIDAPAGDYIEAMFNAYLPTRGPTGYAHAVRRMVYAFNPVIPAGGTAAIDMVMPDASADGTCSMTGCTIDVAAAGFGPGEILSVTLVAGFIVDDHSFSQRLATLVAGADGSARGTFVVDGLARADYGIAVGSTPPIPYAGRVRSAETARTLSVGPPPCTDPPCAWWAFSGRLSARASLTLPAAGRAIASLTVTAPASGVKVGGRITAGPGCGADAELIAAFPGWTARAATERTQRVAIRGAALDRLHAIERAGTPLWVRFSVGKRWSCVRLWRRD